MNVERNTELISVMIAPSRKAKIDKLVSERGYRISEVVRMALEEGLPRIERLIERQLPPIEDGQHGKD